MTTAPAPTSAPAPIRTPPSTTAPEPSDARSSTTVRDELPVLFGLQATVGARRARVLVVDEHHAVADEDLVADLDAVTDERVALNLAVARRSTPRLDLDERPDPGPVADPAAVEIRERLDDDVLAELDVAIQPVRRLVGRAQTPSKKARTTAATTTSICSSVMPGKIGSDEQLVAPERSDTGNDAGLVPELAVRAGEMGRLRVVQAGADRRARAR